MEFNELIEKYNKLMEACVPLREEAQKIVINLVTSMLAGTSAKKLNYVVRDDACGIICCYDRSPVLAVELNNTNSFDVDVYEKRGIYSVSADDLSTEQIFNLMIDLQCLNDYLLGEMDLEVDLKVNENGVVEYI